MTELKLPIAFDIKAKQLKNGLWKYDYIEKFDPEDYEAFKDSFDTLKLVFPCTLDHKKIKWKYIQLQIERRFLIA